MSFIGKDGKAAPKLREAHLNTVDMQMAYEQCIQVSVLIGACLYQMEIHVFERETCNFVNAIPV